MKSIRSIAWLMLIFAFLSSEAAWAAVVAGKISALKGTVIATGEDGQERRLRKGKPFFEGDKIATAKRAAVAMKFKDGTFTAIEVYNDFGQVTIDEPGFGTEVADSKTAPTPAKRMKLRTIDNIMRSMSSITRTFSRPRISVP